MRSQHSALTSISWLTHKSLPSYNDMDKGMVQGLRAALQAEVASGRRLSLKMTIDEFDDDLSTGLKDALCLLCDKIRQKFSEVPSAQQNNLRSDGLPNMILFPYARHSPYPELCHLASIFKPKDIWPCTVDQRWKEGGMTTEHSADVSKVKR